VPLVTTGAKRRVCLITTGQPANNPRLVKEADALVEAGYSVHAIGGDCGLWPSRMDAAMMATRSWTFEYVGGVAATQPLRHWYSRARYSVSRRLAGAIPGAAALANARALARIYPYLLRAALRYRADLYIAHHLAALPATVRAAAKFGARAGYDVEDHYTAMRPFDEAPSPLDETAKRIESRNIGACHYITASSQPIADAYAVKYSIPPPATILNVFPLRDRPEGFREGTATEPLRLYWFSQRIGPNRGIENIVQALGMLRDRSVELHLRGNWQSGYRERLGQLMSSSGMGQEQLHAHAPAPPDDMVRVSAQYDVGLALEPGCSLNNLLSASNKMFTYVLGGSAVAATATPGHRSIADTAPGAVSFLYTPGDIAGLAAQIKNWSSDRVSLAVARRKAWAAADGSLNWDREKGKFLGIVERMISVW
jgi:glycosyltransferase involved in cell wall biosynthesis